MLTKPIFSPPEFAQFLIRHIEQQEPTLQFEPTDAEDPFQYKVIHKDTMTEGRMNLHNAWEDYVRTGDMNAIIDYLNHQLAAFQFMRQLEHKEVKGVDLTKIYPTIRTADFRIHQKLGDDMLYDDRVPRLDSLFVENRDGYYVFLTKEYIKPALVYKNEEEIKAHAYDNLRSQGWNAPITQFPSPPMFHEGMFHVFEKTSYPFQHQFFLPDMAQGHLPPTYLFAVPARDIAVVLTTEKPINSLQAAKKAAVKTGFVRYVHYCFRTERRPIATYIYWSYHGRVCCVPFS